MVVPDPARPIEVGNPDDERVLGLAVTGNVDDLKTGDNDLPVLASDLRRADRDVTAAHFWAAQESRTRTTAAGRADVLRAR